MLDLLISKYTSSNVLCAKQLNSSKFYQKKEKWIVVSWWVYQLLSLFLFQVNAWGNVVYDEYVRPLEYIVDFRSAISGIRPHHLRKG